MSGQGKDSEKNKFERLLIIILSLFIVFLIIYNYFYATPKGEINPGIIILLSFLVILSLSESFDNFSVGKIFSLQKTLRDKNTDISQFKTENVELRNQIVNISTSVSQGQMNATVVNTPELFANLYNVKPAEKEEIDEKEKTEIEEEREDSTKTRTSSVRKMPRKKINFKKLEKYGINKFINEYGLRHNFLINDAKLSTDFYNLDPISNYTPIFDGYVKTPDSDVFIEVKKGLNILSRDRFYVMLSKIYHYNKVKKSNAYLVLILIDTTEEDEKRDKIVQISRYFEPAISSGLLKIINYTLDESELSEMYEDED